MQSLGEKRSKEGKSFILAGRQSLLSRIQISLLAQAIQKKKPKIQLDFLCQTAQGDRDSKKPLWKMPLEGKGVFSSEFSSLLLEHKADIIVHSHKDLALEGHPKTEVIPILRRADQRDILLFKREALAQVPKKLSLLTSSPRRMFLLESFLKQALPHSLQDSPLLFKSVRGNLSTRIKKLSLSKAHALVLAKAALDRLLTDSSHLFLDPRLIEKEELEREQREILKILKEECSFMVLPLSHCPNAPAQGSLAAEIRKGDQEARDLLFPIEDPSNTRTSLAERKELGSFGGGCHQRIGIACIERRYGEIRYLRGKNELGESFWKKNFIPKEIEEDKKNEGLEAEKKLERAWPRPGEALEIKRTPFDPSLLASLPRYAWVSRKEAWPDKWKSQIEIGKNIIWTSGVRSFFSLAKQDLWVNGCAEGLGEEDPGIENLLGLEASSQKLAFIKLSHQKRIVCSRWDTLSTYKIELSGNIDGLKEKTYFFWKSATQFEWASSLYPEILKARHACGPGLSYQYIQKKALGPVRIYLDYESWLQDLANSA